MQTKNTQKIFTIFWKKTVGGFFPFKPFLIFFFHLDLFASPKALSKSIAIGAKGIDAKSTTVRTSETVRVAGKKSTKVLIALMIFPICEYAVDELFTVFCNFSIITNPSPAMRQNSTIDKAMPDELFNTFYPHFNF
ncbi:MAG: hypothetical protein QXJ62_00985 [Nitrososphaeria archaeon]